MNPYTASRSVPHPEITLEVLTLRAAVHRIEVTCGDGVRRNVVLGPKNVEDRLACDSYVGGIMGRYANRIARGQFSLAGSLVQVEVHDRGNSLHAVPRVSTAKSGRSSRPPPW